jgi:glycogen synthase kinase 3 beta
VFRSRAAADALDLIAKLLDYTPTTRLTAIEAMTHPFFDELRQPETKMASGHELPSLFNFTSMELSIRPELNQKLVPSFAEQELLARGIDIHQFTPVAIPKGLTD